MVAKTGVVVVGGGLAGIAAALTLAEQGQRVTLIEQNAKLGGLWQTITTQQGHTFTQGVRIPETTRVPELDNLLFGDLNNGQWEIYQTLLREGHVFNGKMNDRCGCIDTTLMPENTFQRGLVDLLQANGDLEFNYPHNKAQLDAFYGETFTESVFRPLMRKYTGQELEQLAVHTHRILIPQRLKVGNAALANQLRCSNQYQQKIAHESWLDLGDSYAGRFVYPKSGESVSWIDDMTARAEAMGVKILTGAQVSTAHHTHHRVTGVSLADGTRINCQGLVWTLPSVFLANAANLPYVGTPPKTRDLHITYLTLKQPAQTDMFYLTDYDANRAMFRAAFLNNLTDDGKTNAPHRVTIETYADPSHRNDLAALENQVIDELCATGVITNGRDGIAHHEHVVHRNIIPIYSPAQRTETEYNTGYLTSQLENVIIGGRGSLRAFLAPHVFIEIYNAIKAVYGSTQTALGVSKKAA